jgi:hypothetical protein
MMKNFNKRLVSLLASLVIVMQSSLVSATLMDYELEFSSVDDVVVGESFDVDVYLDISPETELITFGFNFDNVFTHLSFDGFTTPAWIASDVLNDVSGLADVFGPNGDDIQIATLHFTALSAGTENVSAYGEFFENGGGAYFYNFIDDSFVDGSVGGSFNVNTKVPEPSSLAIMLLGVFGLARMRAINK